VRVREAPRLFAATRRSPRLAASMVAVHGLHSIIDTRRRQANFQLIVITHDEAFTRNLAGYVDHCWKVYRDSA